MNIVFLTKQASTPFIRSTIAVVVKINRIIIIYVTLIYIINKKHIILDKNQHNISPFLNKYNKNEKISIDIIEKVNSRFVTIYISHSVITIEDTTPLHPSTTPIP